MLFMKNAFCGTRQRRWRKTQHNKVIVITLKIHADFLKVHRAVFAITDEVNIHWVMQFKG